MSTKHKINLIYVASIGHSGSTLLESILGSHSQITTCGEIHIWPHEIIQNGVLPCSCGKAIPECLFWSEMSEKVNPIQQPQPQIHFFREKHNAGHTLRINQQKYFGNKKLSLIEEQQIQQYGQNNHEVFTAFLNLMEKTNNQKFQWIVDASKDPYRLLWLIRSNLFNIKVIHIVKNPRAFVYSMFKRLTKNQQKIPLIGLYESARQSLKWSIENYLTSLIAKNYLTSSNYFLVNYEKLASQPVQSFEEICEFVSCNFELEAINNFRQGSVHTIAGNPMRHQKQGIFLDEKWKNLLPKSNRQVAELLTSFNRSDYGY